VTLYKTGTGSFCSGVAYKSYQTVNAATIGSQKIATFTNIPSGTYYVGIGGCHTEAVGNFNRLVITSYEVDIDASLPSQWTNPIRLIRTVRQVTASASIGGTQAAITSMSLSGGFLSSDKAGVATGSGITTTYVFSSVPPGVYTLTMVLSPYPNRIERITVGDVDLLTSTYAIDATQRTITVTVGGPSSGALATLSNGASCTTGSAGNCTIANVPDGTYTLTGSATGYVTTTSTSFTTSSGTTTASVGLTANAATTRSIVFTTTSISGATITVSSGQNCVTVSATCTISGLALTTLSYTASKTGYVTQTDIQLDTSQTTASVVLTASATYVLTVSVSGRVTSESIIVSVSGGYTCTIATNGSTSGSCTVTVPAGPYTASATTATKQGSNTVTVSADAAVSIALT